MCNIKTLYGRYFEGLRRFKWAVIVFWAIALIIGAVFGLNFLSAVSIDVQPPKGTTAYEAKQVFEDIFPTQSSEDTYLLYFNCGPTCVNSTNPTMESNLNRVLSDAEGWESGFVVSTATYWTYPNTPVYATVKAKFLSKTNPKAMIGIITTKDEHSTTRLASFVKQIRQSISDLSLPSGYYGGVVSGQTILVDSVEESTTTVFVIDSIVLPLALMVLMYVVQSWRMVVIPVLNVAICLLFSFAIMYGFTINSTKAPSFVPSVMEAMVIALSIDYSLFLLSRYRFEVLNKGRTPIAALKESLFHAGEVVFMSGLTLVSCFLGMTAFPIDTISMVGVGCGLCLTMALIINLTLTPSLILAFPNFFSTFQFLPFCTKREEANHREDENEDFADAELIDRNAENEDADSKGKLRNSYWYKSTWWFIRWPWVLLTIIIPLALITPAAINVLDLKVSISADQIAPRTSMSLDVLGKLKDDFSPGFTNPLYVVVKSNAGPNSLATQTFNPAGILCQLIVNNTVMESSGIMSIAYVNSERISWDQSLALKQQSPPYAQYFEQSVDSSNASTLITLTTPFEPWGDDVIDFKKNMQDLFSNSLLDQNVGYYLAGGPIWVVAASEKTYELFPWIVFATVMAIFMMISLLFWSAFIPLRYAFTLVFPLSFIFGLAVMIYQNGAMDWLGWAALHNEDGMFWLTPILTFPICTGLALDYDIFLMCRVAEYRNNSYTNEAAILKAVHETGSIITAAGIIMAIAFGGLMFSKTDTLNQIGWILFSSVLFDTFIVRTVLVPAVLSLAGWLNWWPRKVPQIFLKNEFGEPDVTFGLQNSGGSSRLLSMGDAKNTGEASSKTG